MASRGTITQRADGRWQGKLQLPKDPLTGKAQKPKYVYSESLPESKRKLDENGKPVFKNHKGKQECERKLEALIKEVDAGVMVGHSKMTVAGWLDKYLSVYCSEREVTTIEGYTRYVNNHIIPVIGSVLLKDLKSIHIQNFYNHERTIPRMRTQLKDGKTILVMKDNKPVPVMKDGKPVIGYSEKTILQEHRILKRAFDKATNDGFMMKNPCDGVDAPSPVEYEPTIYNEDEYLLLLDKLEGHRMESVILIAGMCGLRRAELMGLTWDDVNLETGIISVERNVVPTSDGNITKDPKTRKSAREFSIPSGIIPRLKQIRGIGRLYNRLDGDDYHPGSVSRMFKEFLEVNGLRHIRLHDLRHFNGTMMLKHGVTEREASERLGHSNLMMTKKYQHVLKDMDQSSADKLNAIFTTK